MTLRKGYMILITSRIFLRCMSKGKRQRRGVQNDDFESSFFSFFFGLPLGLVFTSGIKSHKPPKKFQCSLLFSFTHFFFFLSTCQDSARGDAHRGLRSPASPALSHGGVDLYPLGLPLSLVPFCRPVAAAVAAAVRFQHGAPFLPPL